jgi:hypothetical protein
VLDFILLVWDTYKQSNTRKIKKNLLLTLKSSVNSVLFFCKWFYFFYML